MINRRHVISLCAQAWGKFPDEIEARVDAGLITMHQLMSAAKIQAASQPLSGEVLINMVLPGRKAALRKLEADRVNAATFEKLKKRVNK